MNAQQPKKAPADPNAPKELGKPLVPATQVTRVRFSPDGTTLAAACYDGTVKRIKDPEAVALALARPPGKIKDAANDINLLAAAELPAVTGHNGWVSAVAFAGGTLFSADSWGRLTASDVSAKDPKQLWSVEAAHDGWLRSLAVSPDGGRVATGGRDGLVRLWNATDSKKSGETELKSDVLSVCFGADGKSVWCGDLFGVVREVAGGKVSRTFEAKELHKLDRIQDVGGVKCLLVSPDGKTLLVGGAEPKTGGFVQAIPLLIAFDLGSGKRVGQYKGASDNEGYVTDLAWHPDGYAIGTTSGQPGQGKFFFWKVGEEKPFFVSKPVPNCHSVAVSGDGRTIAVSATNANSSGNGRVKGTGGEYPANNSPIQLWSVPKL